MIGRLALLIIAIPVVVSAAQPGTSGDLTAALQKAKVGATLRVETASTVAAGSSQVIGRFAGITRGVMVINGKSREEIQLDTVRSMAEFQSARSAGIKWGALIGLGAGIAVAALTDKSNDATVSDSHFDLARYSYHAVAGILVGGSIGGIVGSTRGHWEPIYP
jgi:hypothetical protein